MEMLWKDYSVLDLLRKKEVNMFTKIKNALQILVCAALVIQLGGCIFVNRGHHDSRWHHDNDSDHNSSIDIQVHGE